MPEKINHKIVPKEVVNSFIHLYNQGEFQQILEKEKKFSSLYQDSIEVLNIFGSNNLALQNFKRAITNFNKAIKLNSNIPTIYYNLGLAYHHIGNMDDAIVNYKKAIDIKQDYEEALNNMGMSLQEKGDIVGAIDKYNKVLAINPKHAGAYYNLGNVFYSKDNLILAIENFNRAIDIKPDYADAYFNLGNALNKQGKLEEAIESFNRVLSIKPDFAEACYNWGIVLQDQGKIDEAIKIYTKALSIKPDYGSAKHMLSALTGNINKTAPREFVENLFDGYSHTFESSLVDKLEYKIPKLIKDILIKPTNKETLGSVLDLGCGTGLFGTEIKNYCSKLEGIDLAKKMLAIANQKNVYDKLTQTDIVEYLSTMPLDFDYYVALDVFIYVGELTEIFRLIKSRNKKSGHLVFSTEHTENDGYHLLRTARYSHSKSYIESLCKKFDYNISHFSTNDLRKHKGDFLTGGIYVLSFKS